MRKGRPDTAIDQMRLVAAILVITIHTSPLASFTAAGDFILTRAIARVAVPFFFMTTGYFTLSRYHKDDRRLAAFLKKTGVIYAAAILAYLPLNLYNGYFDRPDFLPRLIKDLIFNGTLYHLWYLPASMLGMVIAWRLVEKLDYKKGLAAAGVLYLIGLLGDSYYGLAARLPGLKAVYDQLFRIFDYTRNGLFFAPIFLMLGGLIAEKKRRPTGAQAAAGLAVSLFLMLAEAWTLHQNGLQRHDSMYVFLLPCMVFLFYTVLLCPGKKARGLRIASLLIYLIHPMVIVGVRLAARVLDLKGLLVENSLVHFIAVAAVSLAVSFAAAALWARFPKKERHCVERERAYIELDLAHLSHNAAVLQGAMPRGCELMAVVKTEAYGHGAYAVAAHLEREGVRAFAAATVDEGIRLRRYGLRGDILILGYTDVHRARELRRYRLTQTLIDGDYARRLEGQGVRVPVHIAVDTGMHRLGFAADDYAGVARVFSMKHLNVTGMFTHLCCCDSRAPEDMAFTREQIKRFYALTDWLKEKGFPVPKTHIQSSYGLLNYPELECDYVRAGISLYGAPSAPGDRTALGLDLRPVLALKARVVLIRDVPKGEFVGYGRAWQARRDSRIAILPIGYGDGFPRSLSCGRAWARLGTYTVPIIGRICMDQLAVDITDAPGVAVGDTAALIENEPGSPLSAPYAAEQSGSISNELLCRMGARLPVVMTNGEV